MCVHIHRDHFMHISLHIENMHLRTCNIKVSNSCGWRDNSAVESTCFRKADTAPLQESWPHTHTMDVGELVPTAWA